MEPSPKWLKDAIEATERRSINNVVDVTNYAARNLQPLHAFDAARNRGGSLIVRCEKVEKPIRPSMRWSARSTRQNGGDAGSAERPLVVAGVMGAVDLLIARPPPTWCSRATTHRPTRDSRNGPQLGLSSDGSIAFGHDVDPLRLTYASLRAVDLVLEVAGGTVDGNRIEVGSRQSDRDA